MCVLDWLMKHTANSHAYTHTQRHTHPVSADAKYKLTEFISNKRLSRFQCARTQVPGKAGTS